MTNWGLTDAGFNPMRQSDCAASLTAALQAQFGNNINTAPESVFGQLIAVFSERDALWWENAEAVYSSQYPAGASGVTVDNILSLNGLTRLGAKATVSNPTPEVSSNGITTYGLVLYGTPGTLIPAGALINTSSTPAASFTLDNAVTIAAAQNEIQQLVFSSTPTSGSFSLAIVDPAGATLTTPALSYSAQAADVQTAIAGLVDSATNIAYFTDVAVTRGGAGFIITFGANQPATNQPSSAATPIATLTVVSSTLYAGQTVVNIGIAQVALGAPAQGIGTATCTTTGPTSAVAGTLSVIGSPQTGWTGVTNQLDAVVGTVSETDAQALSRFAASFGINGSGPIASIVQEVAALPGVTEALGFVNKTNTAVQVLRFANAPTAGSFALATAVQTTAPIAYNASAQVIQAALNALPQTSLALVTGSYASGFLVDFNGSQGGQPQPALLVVNNTTGQSASVTFGRPAHSLEVIAQGGDASAIAKAILNAAPAGIAIYGAPSLVTFGNVVQGATSVTVNQTTNASIGQAVTGSGLGPNTYVTSISNTAIGLSQQAIGSAQATPLSFTYTETLFDAFGNAQQIAFSRPVQVPIFVNIVLTTDLYNQPGVAASGSNANAQFNLGAITSVQNQVCAVGNSFGIGALIVFMGTNGLAGAFESVPGIQNFSLSFGTSPSTLGTQNLQLQPSQVPLFTPYNVSVSFQ